MPFCVNCGVEYEGFRGICRACWKDPTVPHKNWEAMLERLKRDPELCNRYPDISYKKEKLSLVIAILIALLLVVIFSTVTLGLALLIVVGSVIYTRIRWLHSRAGLMQITRDNYPHIYSMAQTAAGRLRIPMPPLFIKQTPIPNAFTTGFFDENWIIIHSGLIDMMSNEELMSVIGHEMGHIKYRHVTWMMMTSPAQAGHAPMIATLLHPVFNNWHLRCEYTADRAGLVAQGELEGCLMTEIKLLSGTTLPENFDLRQYMQDIEREKDSLSDKAIELFMQSHPYARNRMKQMAEFYKSDKYRLVQKQYTHPEAV